MTQGSEKEREEFEAWARSCGFYLGRDPISGEYTDAGSSDAYKGWQAARRAQPAQIPEGWKLVPVTPTQEMIDAACNDGVNLNGRPVWKQSYDVQATWRWQRMLDAAPKPTDGLMRENPATKQGEE